MARILKGSHSFTCTPHIHPLTEWTIPAFAFPAEAGTYLPTLEGWKAEKHASGAEMVCDDDAADGGGGDSCENNSF